MSKPKKISSWRELSDVIQLATSISDPARCQPVGTARVEYIGTDIARLTIVVDLLPIGPQIETVRNMINATVESF
jgi:hypothetical protein